MSPVVGGVTNHYKFCSWKTSNADGPGYCPNHMQICHESESPDGRHAGTLIYTYRKTTHGSVDQRCGLCDHLDEEEANKKKKDREDKEKRAKKAADKVALKQDPGKTRTKARHDKSEKTKQK
ncbi:hypothetical protein Q7P35_009350 [Cladosporium inversicolor]